MKQTLQPALLHGLAGTWDPQSLSAGRSPIASLKGTTRGRVTDPRR